MTSKEEKLGTPTMNAVTDRDEASRSQPGCVPSATTSGPEPSAAAALAEWFQQEAAGAALAAELEKAVLAALEPAVEAFRRGERSEDILRRVRQHNASEADYRRYAKNAENFALAAQIIPPSEEPRLHPDTALLVDRFALALAEKLADAERKYGYSNGWLDANWRADCIEALREHVEKGDPRDVAAYCAFAWHHGWSTNAVARERSEHSSPPQVEREDSREDQLAGRTALERSGQ